MRIRRIDAVFHIKVSISRRMGIPEYPCACSRCKGGRIRKPETIKKHHRRYGRDIFLPHPVIVSSATVVFLVHSL